MDEMAQVGQREAQATHESTAGKTGNHGKQHRKAPQVIQEMAQVIQEMAQVGQEMAQVRFFRADPHHCL